MLLAGVTLLACGAASIQGDEIEVPLPERAPSDPGVGGSSGGTDGATVQESPLDSGDPGDGGTGMPDAPAKTSYRAFLTSNTYTGNLGGLAGADAKCQAAADAKGFPGTYRAWLSVAGTNAGDRITSPGPFQLVTGEVVATTKAQLVSGTLQRRLDKDENGAVAPDAEDRTWTATSGAGTATGPDCGGWAALGGGGRVGEAEHADSRWTTLTDEACTEVNRLICFEL